MGVRRYEDLDAWKAADELKREVYALTETGPASKDFEFRNQIRDSAASATKNIAEGFGRFRPADFARFMDFSISSTMETQDSLKEGIDRKHFTFERAQRARDLADRSLQVSKGLKRYLRSCRNKKLPFI